VGRCGAAADGFAEGSVLDFFVVFFAIRLSTVPGVRIQFTHYTQGEDTIRQTARAVKPFVVRRAV
jgi:hypothetical protein